VVVLLVTRFLNSFLLNFNLLIFWVIVGNHLKIRKNCIDISVIDCETHCTFILVLLEYLPSRGFFNLY